MSTDPNANTVYIIDYGLSKRYKHPLTNLHIPFKDNKLLTGTVRYASLSTHNGYEQGRRDDLECLGYTLVYLLNGRLPWQGIKAKRKYSGLEEEKFVNKEKKYAAILKMKKELPLEILCKGLPAEFLQYMHYVRAIKFDDSPDYKRLRKLFSDLFKKQKYALNFQFDWNIKKIDLAAINNNIESANESSQAGIY